MNDPRPQPRPGHSEAEETAELKRLQRWKGSKPYTPHVLGEDAIELFNGQIKRRHAKFGKLSEVWEQLVPQIFQPHTYLATFSRGTLTVYVDSSAHLYELRQLLLAGLQDQILLACSSQGLKKIALKRGTADPSSMVREPD